MPDLTFVVETKCEECGDTLYFEQNIDRYGNVILEVELCETCVERAVDKAKDEAERAWEDKVDEAYNSGVADGRAAQ
jgi:hypothetical protein